MAHSLSQFRTCSILLALGLAFCLGGCAGMLPGGGDKVNSDHYDSAQNLRDWTESLEPGMSKGETFARLGRVERDFKRLTRPEIIEALYGGSRDGLEVDLETLNRLEGYRLNYSQVKSHHGIVSPIRVQTDVTGYRYQLDLVFRDGRLIEKPALTGGFVDETRTRTLFDYLNPGSVINHIE